MNAPVLRAKLKPSLAERALPPFRWRQLLPQPIIGVDEVGRGCLAGRVYAAAVVVDLNRPIRGITDSKLLSEIRRQTLCDRILRHWQVGIGYADVDEIERLNILHAALLAMKRAILALGLSGGHIVVDGNQRIAGLESYSQTTVVKGDLRCLPISAASIVAKVTRDAYMTELAREFPQFGFESNKGYGTDFHRNRIERFGPSPCHRRAFSGVREFCGAEPPQQ